MKLGGKLQYEGKLKWEGKLKCEGRKLLLSGKMNEMNRFLFRKIRNGCDVDGWLQCVYVPKIPERNCLKLRSCIKVRALQYIWCSGVMLCIFRTTVTASVLFI